MKFKTHKIFDKQYAKLRLKEQKRVDEALKLFLTTPNNRKLRNHALRGEWEGFFSISAGGDLRIHYKILENNSLLFVAAVGTHAQLYE
ncbi:MAG: type II toxin-antitoxin system mRNA interferase toxin, RelE/StbE family [Candidatus Margulisbacteria bacterium]|nr:type II toxin-antitoxin system mRNA interferase toxin, RelE/StbE family [Candidatus Margulisiibacteriota bacterium]